MNPTNRTKDVQIGEKDAQIARADVAAGRRESHALHAAVCFTAHVTDLIRVLQTIHDRLGGSIQATNFIQRQLKEERRPKCELTPRTKLSLVERCWHRVGAEER